MKLILLESVYGLGRPGDEVSVKSGYARNYLLPKRLAVRHNADALRMLKRLRQKAEEEERAMVSSMEELAAKLNGQELSLEARATEDGHLFGSVTEKDISKHLQAAGWDVPPRAVRLAAHLKEAGDHEVELHLYGEIVASIKVEVVPIDMEGLRIEVLSAEELAQAGAAEDAEAEAEAEAGEGSTSGSAETEGTPAVADAS